MVLGVDRDEQVALAQLPFVLLRLVLRDAHSDERAGEPADRSAGRCAGECGQDRAGRDERAEAGDRERADADEPASEPAEDAAGRTAGRRSFGRLGVLLVGEIAASAAVREQHGDVRAREPRGSQAIHDAHCSHFVTNDADDGAVHRSLPGWVCLGFLVSYAQSLATSSWSSMRALPA